MHIQLLPQGQPFFHQGPLSSHQAGVDLFQVPGCCFHLCHLASGFLAPPIPSFSVICPICLPVEGAVTCFATWRILVTVCSRHVDCGLSRRLSRGHGLLRWTFWVGVFVKDWSEVVVLADPWSQCILVDWRCQELGISPEVGQILFRGIAQVRSKIWRLVRLVGAHFDMLCCPVCRPQIGKKPMLLRRCLERRKHAVHRARGWRRLWCPKGGFEDPWDRQAQSLASLGYRLPLRPSPYVVFNAVHLEKRAQRLIYCPLDGSATQRKPANWWGVIYLQVGPADLVG